MENAELTGTDGKLKRYAVVPVLQGNTIHWIDAAGYELAKSRDEEGVYSPDANRNDFELRLQHHIATVERTFKVRS
ncbi:hypothetical protein D3C80_2120780 [compost metagenome]